MYDLFRRAVDTRLYYCAFLRTLLGLEAIMAGNVRPIPAGGHFCLICTKVIKGSYATAKYHFRDLHWSGAPSYTCPAPQCQRVYTSKAAFKMHRTRNHPDWRGVPLDTFLTPRWNYPVKSIMSMHLITLHNTLQSNSWMMSVIWEILLPQNCLFWFGRARIASGWGWCSRL